MGLVVIDSLTVGFDLKVEHNCRFKNYALGISASRPQTFPKEKKGKKKESARKGLRKEGMQDF